MYWYTILGTIENQFPNRKLREFKVFLQALDRDMPELLCSGHPFPKENYNINKLFDIYGEIAADYYVKNMCMLSNLLKQCLKLSMT